MREETRVPTVFWLVVLTLMVGAIVSTLGCGGVQ